VKRGLRVKTGIVVPSRPSASRFFGRINRTMEKRMLGEMIDANGLGVAEAINMMPLVPLIRCTNPKPCGHCWYCQKAAER
jgi:hypothetical protein